MEEKERYKEGVDHPGAKTTPAKDHEHEQQQELGDTQENTTKDTKGQQTIEDNALEDHLLDEESNLIPGRRKNDQAENEQQEITRGEEIEEGKDRNFKQQTQLRSSEVGNRKDLVSENGLLKGQLQRLKREYREVRQRYDKLKQRSRGERKVLRKYRRLLIGAFETDNLAMFREESSVDPQSLSAPSESPVEEANSEKLQLDIDNPALVDPLRTDEELERGKQSDFFNDNMEHELSPEGLLDYQREKQNANMEKSMDLGSASASAAAATHGQGTAAAAAAAAVASCSVEPSSSEVAKNKRKRDFVSSKDSSWSSEPQSSSSTTSKIGLENYHPEEEYPKEEEEDPRPNLEGDYSRFTNTGNEGVESKRGRHSIWKPEEERLFDEGFHRYGCRWKLIQENLLPQKSRQQIQSHGTYLLRQGRLRKHQAGRHKKLGRDGTRRDDKRNSRNERNVLKNANDESSRPVRQYDVESVT
ncbi:hypothetical protein GpartN1_g3545.t1 [Galdieria partita]|uniref:Myb-like domain-containing protein n=1 Tax=Galdieria partita TaxID=83374 RepID=A0A9C7UQA4_9RHOD|nr:hypothetical protein GpartN1_g3545.t1 [Galdieria partita]